jgi:hypothetical protein
MSSISWRAAMTSLTRHKTGALIYTARELSLARQGQVTDRYIKAIEQLGSDKWLDVQIGGIYALERIARDSPRDHPTIMARSF